MSQNDKILVAGASGQLGELVLQELLKLTDAKRVIATSRTPEKLSQYAKQGVEVRALDLNADIEQVKQAFSGAKKVLLISTNDIGNRLPQHKKAVQAAKGAGVEHILYTSWLRTDMSKAMVAYDHRETEKAILDSGLKYTFLRNSYYTDNLEQTLKTALQIGKIFGANGTGKASFVTRQDCASAAAHALVSNQAVDRVIDVSGPEAIDFVELAKRASSFFGKPIEYINLSATELEEMYKTTAGLPEFIAKLLVDFDLSIQRGEIDYVSADVSKLIGREGQKVEEYFKQLV